MMMWFTKLVRQLTCHVECNQMVSLTPTRTKKVTQCGALLKYIRSYLVLMVFYLYATARLHCHGRYSMGQ